MHTTEMAEDDKNTVLTVAGTGSAGCDDGPGRQSTFNYPNALCAWVDPQTGHTLILIAEWSNRIRAYDTKTSMYDHFICACSSDDYCIPLSVPTSEIVSTVIDLAVTLPPGEAGSQSLNAVCIDPSRLDSLFVFNQNQIWRISIPRARRFHILKTFTACGDILQNITPLLHMICEYAVPSEPAGEAESIAGRSDFLERDARMSDGVASNASFGHVQSLLCSKDGRTLFVPDFGASRVCEVDVQTKRVTTIAGTGTKQATGIDGPTALTTSIQSPFSVAFDPTSIDGESRLYIGCPFSLHLLDRRAKTLTALNAGDSTKVVVVTPSGHSLLCSNTTIVAFDPINKSVLKIAGNRLQYGVADGDIWNARIAGIFGVAIVPDESAAYFSENYHQFIRRVQLPRKLCVPRTLIANTTAATNTASANRH